MLRKLLCPCKPSATVLYFFPTLRCVTMVSLIYLSIHRSRLNQSPKDARHEYHTYTGRFYVESHYSVRASLQTAESHDLSYRITHFSTAIYKGMFCRDEAAPTMSA